MKTTRALMVLAIVGWLPHAASAASPILIPGIWKNITPPTVHTSFQDHVFCQGVTIDPSHPTTLYLCICAYDAKKGGLYKTTDAGSTFKNEPFFVSAEQDGINWKPLNEQKFSAAPFEMAYDSVHKILYSASWEEGLLAIKLSPDN